MTTELENRLGELLYKNAVIRYNGKIYKIDRYKVSYGKLRIVATPSVIIVKVEDIEQFLEDAEILENKVVKVTPSHSLERDDFGYNKINKGLLDAFERVQKDESFIPKAKAMTMVVREIVALEKTKIEILKMSRNG